jgi:hypothetical protein
MQKKLPSRILRKFTGAIPEILLLIFNDHEKWETSKVCRSENITQSFMRQERWVLKMTNRLTYCQLITKLTIISVL